MTALAWSHNGTSIAVGYGKVDHDSWCEHQSIIHIWNIFRREFNSKKADMTLELPNCATTIAYHPENPLIIAVGTVNGEIYIWNLNETEQKQGQPNLKSKADEYIHREPIKGLEFILHESIASLQKEVLLASISTDGKILVWHAPLRQLRFPIKGHIFARNINN